MLAIIVSYVLGVFLGVMIYNFKVELYCIFFLLRRWGECVLIMLS